MSGALLGRQLNCRPNRTSSGAVMPMGRRSGLTWIEVLVIAVVLGVLLCLAIVWIGTLRESSRRQVCLNNLRQLAAGLRGYAEYFDAYPYATVVNEKLPPEQRLSWYVGAWSSVGEGQTELLVDLQKPWDTQGNLQPRIRTRTARSPLKTVDSALGPVPWFRCPSSREECPADMPGLTSYVGIAGLGEDAASLPPGDPRDGIWGYDRQTPLKAITDGTETTLLLAESALDNGPWTAGARPTVRGVDPEQVPCLGPGRQFGGNHPGGGNAAFADGAARFLSNSIDPGVFAHMATIGLSP